MKFEMRKGEEEEECRALRGNLGQFIWFQFAKLSARECTTHVSKIKIERKEEKRETTRRCVYVAHTDEHTRQRTMLTKVLTHET